MIHWEQSRTLLSFPRVGLHLSWYGIFFSLGIFLSSFAGIRLATALCKDSALRKELRTSLENFALGALLVIIIGARVAYVLFYGGSFYFEHPLEIIKIWKGGLSSHGAIAALILWAAAFSRLHIRRLPMLSLTYICDLCGAAFGGAALSIRIGNFMNQEILGTPTYMPWGVIFSNDGNLIPRHPVQLYEGVGYLLLSCILYRLCYRGSIRLGSGYSAAGALIGVAGIRFCAEFFKTHQGAWLDEGSFFTIGQWLSIPMIFLGGAILWIASKKKAV